MSYFILMFYRCLRNTEELRLPISNKCLFAFIKILIHFEHDLPFQCHCLPSSDVSVLHHIEQYFLLLKSSTLTFYYELFSAVENRVGSHTACPLPQKISESVVKSDKTGKPKLKSQSRRTKDMFWHESQLAAGTMAFLLAWSKVMHP